MIFLPNRNPRAKGQSSSLSSIIVGFFTCVDVTKLQIRIEAVIELMQSLHGQEEEEEEERRRRRRRHYILIPGMPLLTALHVPMAATARSDGKKRGISRE